MVATVSAFLTVGFSREVVATVNAFLTVGFSRELVATVNAVLTVGISHGYVQNAPGGSPPRLKKPFIDARTHGQESADRGYLLVDFARKKCYFFLQDQWRNYGAIN